MTRSGLIGRHGDLPWRLPADLQRFKRLTMGHAVIMGRKTYDSLGGRTLPGRRLIVIARTPRPMPDGVQLAGSLEEALHIAGGDAEPFVIGGGEIFCLALPLAGKLYVTYVEADLAGDTWFPDWSAEEWQLVESTAIPADAKNEFATTFCVYERDPRSPSSSQSGSSPMAKNKETKDKVDDDAPAAAAEAPAAAAPAAGEASLAPVSAPAFDPNAAAELMNLTYQLLASIVKADWNAYVALCDANITCFEPEAKGHLVAGLDFHKFYFDLGPAAGPRTITLVNPHVRMLGDTAIVCYKRVTQSLDGSGQPQTSEMEETRVWTKVNGAWKHVHFHRSAGG